MHRFRWLLLLVSIGALTGCISVADTRPGPREEWPKAVVDLAEIVARPAGEVIAHVPAGKARLEGEERALALVLSVLQPLDILVVGTEQGFAGHLIPGLLTHSAIYLGTLSSLDSMGALDLMDAKALASFRKGSHVVESEHDGVRLITLQTTLNADSLVVIRPKLSRVEKRETARLLVEHLGTPFDFRIDATDDQRLYCSELVEHVLPTISLRRRTLYDREVILPTDIALKAADNDQMAVVQYIRAKGTSWEIASTTELRADIAAGWN
jgi:hypothetical protein